MTSFKKIFTALLLIAVGLAVEGCSISPQKDSAIPWSRPAGWEGQIPGMGQPTGR